MAAAAVFVLLSAFCLITASPVNGYLSNFAGASSGWAPMSKEKVLAQFEGSHPLRKQFYNNAWEDDDYGSLNKVKDDAIKIIAPLNYGSFAVTDKIVTQIDDERENNKALMVYKEKDVNCTKGDLKNKSFDEETIISQNRTKRILQENPRKLRKLFTDPQLLPNIDKQFLVTDHIEATTRKYEVTETNNDLVYKTRKTSEDQGYFYEKPNTTFTESSDKTGKKNNILADILSKYNIKVDDRLPNYAVSRYRPIKPPKREPVIFVPIPLNIVANNHNLLSILMSHYGPNALVSKGFYQKLRRPEAYKVYPDTDSGN